MNFFEDLPFVHAAISTRVDENMRIGMETTPEERKRREENRQRFLRRDPISPDAQLVTPYLVHGANVEVVKDASLPYLPNTDALVTDVPGLTHGVTVADCVPVFFVDTSSKTIGIAHAGWRGILAGVLENTLARVASSDVGRRNVRVAIGPRIGVCHFEVQKDFLLSLRRSVGRLRQSSDPKIATTLDGSRNDNKFWRNEIETRGGRFFVDLSKACVRRLVALDIPLENIEISSECTYCQNEKYFSHRRDKKEDIEAMIAVIRRDWISPV